LIPLNNDNYLPEAHFADVLRRQSHRSGMLLNADELLGFIRFPSSAVQSPKLLRQKQKTKLAPSDTTAGRGILLGTNHHAGETREVRLTTDQRVRHTHILGEESTEQLLHSYIDGRTAFISAVASAEAAQSKYVLEQTIADAARAEITKDFIPASAYSVKTTTVNLPEVSPSAGAALAVDVEVVIEQTDYLLRPAKEQPAQWMEFQSGSAFEKAKSLAVSISAKALPPKPLNPVVYELVSSPHSTATKLQIEIKGQANAVVVQSATWSDKANFTDNSLVAFKKTGGNALLTLAQTTASDFKTIQDYRQQIQAFILKVGEEHKLQIAQRYENYFVSQQPNDPHFDKYSNQDDPYFTVYGQQFTNGFNSIWNAISIVMTKNGMAPLTADKTFGEISTKFIPYERGLHFASPGVRRFRILLTSSESGVKVEIKTYLYIGWSNAGQNWTRE
jgi:hypothetical protein